MSLADSAVMFFLAVPLALAAGSAFGLRNRLVALIPLLIATFCGGYVGAALRLGILRDSIRYVENLPHSRDVRSCGPPAEFLMLCFEVYIFLPLMLVFAIWALASILLRRQSRNKWRVV